MKVLKRNKMSVHIPSIFRTSVLLCSFLMLLTGSLNSFAQSSSENYISRKTVKVAGKKNNADITDSDVIEEITYFDGLGRPMQIVKRGGGQTQSFDLIQPIEYDNMGRKAVQYLPYAIYITSGSSGNYHDTWKVNQAGFYTSQAHIPSDTRPYGFTLYDDSPLNRIEKQFGAGQNWHPGGDFAGGRYTEYLYLANEPNEVILWKINGDIAEPDGYYAENTLYLTEVVDEDLHRTREYTDLSGKTILKKSFDGTQWLETYYVYDDFNLLRFVIPPKALDALVNNPVQTVEVISYYEEKSEYTGLSYILEEGVRLKLTEGFQCSYLTATESAFFIKGVSSYGYSLSPYSDLCYSYKYDSRKRMIEKKLPGAAPVYMVYDVRDRLVAIQDGNMRERGTWLVTLYDKLDRPVVTLEKTGLSDNPNTLQTTVNGYTAENALNAKLAVGSAMALFEYENFGLGGNTQETEVLSVTYYDDYYGLNAGLQPELNESTLPAAYRNFDTEYTERTHGLATISKVRDLDTENVYYDAANYYDEKGRITKTVTEHKLNNVTLLKNKYDFTSKVLVTAQKQFFGTSSVQEALRYGYDNNGRLISTTHTFGNLGDEIQLDSIQYNHLGQVIGKTLGGGLQQIDYSYNIRGWLESINDPLSLGDDLFAMQLHYNSLGNTDNLGSAACYNGNIAAVCFNDKKTNTLKGYGYSYDEVNRLTAASFGAFGNLDPYNMYSVPLIEYDLNGNIKSLERFGSGSADPIDKLTYTYLANGNQLGSVTDEGTSQGFLDGHSGTDYDYDNNGNMILDRNKGISDIAYNYLNLPASILLGSEEISYCYDAAGTKLQKTDPNGVQTTYLNNFVYEDGSLIYVLHPEGRIKVSGTSRAYEFFLKDHLGNTRVSFGDNDVADGSIDPVNEIYQVTDYYPFGMAHNSSLADASQKYLYNGKELQEETGWYDYGARMYDPSLGRWHCLDPLLEEYYDDSPYAYVKNNPLLYIDPNGMFSFKASGDDMAAAGIEDVEAFALYLLSVADKIQEFSENEDNSDVITEISATTGLSKEEIMSDMQSGNGPTINLVNMANVPVEKQDPDNKTMTLDITSFVGQFEARNNGNEEEDYYGGAGNLMYTLHEYGHYGDKKTNGGISTGDENWRLWGQLEKSTVGPRQQKPVADSGERGRDIDQMILLRATYTKGSQNYVNPSYFQPNNRKATSSGFRYLVNKSGRKF